MKQITILQKASIAIGLCYGLWLGGQTGKSNVTAPQCPM